MNIIQRIEQRADTDCFTACMSSLTGIPYDDLPIMPPKLSGRYTGETRIAGYNWHLWMTWAEHNDYVLSWTNTRPSHAAIMLWFLEDEGAHAVIDTRSADDCIIDPSPYYPLLYHISDLAPLYIMRPVWVCVSKKENDK